MHSRAGPCRLAQDRGQRVHVTEAGRAHRRDDGADVTAVVERAMAQAPKERHPSADEFSEALRRAARLEPAGDDRGGGVWAIVGIDGSAEELFARIRDMAPGAGLVVTAPQGAGRSTLVRRVCWSLGVAGSAVGLLEREAVDFDAAVDMITSGRERSETKCCVRCAISVATCSGGTSCSQRASTRQPTSLNAHEHDRWPL